MAEPDEPIRPKNPAPAYLPRLWKTEPEPEPSEELPVGLGKGRAKGGPEGEAKPARPRKKKRKPDPAAEEGKGSTKLEETPVLDTYEARQRARWLIGGVLGAVGLVALVVVLRSFRGGVEEESPPEAPEVKLVNEGRAQAEQEARGLVENARRSDRAGKADAAVVLLERAAKTYPGTTAALEAMKAIDRHRRKLPLFGADVVEQAAGPKPPAKVAARPDLVGPPVVPPGPIPPATPKDAESPGPVAAAAPAPIAIKPLPPGFREKPGAPLHPSGWPTQILADRDGSVMVLVPAGAFLMGREDGEPAERPTHRVSLSTYYIDRHEVTVRQFVQFLRETGRPLDAAKLLPRETADPPAAPEDLPAVNLSAMQAKAYCTWAGKRLPTEAQWEYAARSADGRVSYWNGELPRKDPAKGSRAVEPVMSLPSDLSPFGAFDMGANAWEWTSEFYDSQYYQQFRNPVADPTGPKQSRARPAHTTVKGGSKVGILTWREGQKSEARLPFLGFRGALPVEGPPVAPVAAPAPNTAPKGDPNLPGGVVPF